MTNKARWALIGIIPAIAIVVAYLATRSPDDAATVNAHASHGAGPTTSTAQPVMLSAAEAERIGVTYAVAAITPIAREIRTVGQVTFDETRMTTISTKIDGWIEALYANFEGQPIGEGTPLFAIYSPMLVTAQEELLLAKRLASDVAAGTLEARENAASLVASARRRLTYWEVPPADVAAIERSDEVRRTITLRSQVSGFVVAKSVQQGQRVMAGEPLYRVANLGTVWVEGEVFERDLSAVRLGQPVTAELDALPGRPRRGRITYIYPTLNAETRTTRVRVELPNPGLQLKPGMYATLSWSGGASAPALAVPRSAVISTGKRDLVFVRRADNMLEPRDVTLGAATATRVEILNGLAVGETIVASATFLLDAESNLGTLLGGMGNMPGMDMTAPTKGPSSRAAPVKAPPPKEDPHAGMDMGPAKKPED